MIANRRLSMPVAAGCFLLLVLWVLYWLFIASRDSGSTTLTIEVDGNRHTETRYDTAEGYRYVAPIIGLGAFGCIVGSVASILVRRKPATERWASALFLSPLVTGLSAAIVMGIGAFLSPGPSELSQLQKVLSVPMLALFYSPGLLLYAWLPTALSGVATACLLAGRHTPPIVPRNAFSE